MNLAAASSYGYTWGATGVGVSGYGGGLRKCSERQSSNSELLLVVSNSGTLKNKKYMRISFE